MEDSQTQDSNWVYIGYSATQYLNTNEITLAKTFWKMPTLRRFAHAFLLQLEFDPLCDKNDLWE